MLEMFQEGGLLMLPIAFADVIAMAICLERVVVAASGSGTA